MYFYLHSPKRKNKGFTILEVLVAITLLSIIMGFFYSFWWLGIKTTKTTRETAQKYTGVRVLLDALARELRSAPEFKYLDYKDFYWGPDPDNPARKKLAFWNVAPDEAKVLLAYPFFVYRIIYYLEEENGEKKLSKEIHPVFPGRKNKEIKGPLLEGNFDLNIEAPPVKIPGSLPEKVVIEFTMEEKSKLRRVVYINALKKAK